MAFLRSAFSSLVSNILPQSMGGGKAVTLSRKIVGQTDTHDDLVEITLTAPSGLTASFLNYGATLTKLVLPDGTNVVLGFDDPKRYLQSHPYIGATVGPVANRIGGSKFSIGQERFHVPANEGGNVVHSGPQGLDRQIWDVEIIGETLALHIDLPDGHQNYPGARAITLTARLAENALRLDLFAETDKTTPINLTLHPYFNLAGDPSIPIDQHALQTDADRIMAVDDELIPTGLLPSVEGADADFRTPKMIGDISLDTAFLIPGEGLRTLAAVTDGERTVFVNSDYPSLQIYTGENLSSAGFVRRAGLALEPQLPPNAVNNPIDGEDSLLHPDETYRYGIEYLFHGPGLPT